MFSRIRLCAALLLVALSVSLALPSSASAMSKSETRAVQEKLTLLGYEPGKIDGAMGPRTKAALRNFQKDSAIKVDGIVGPETKAALESRTTLATVRPEAQNTQLDVYEDSLTDRLAKGSVAIPSRFGKIDLARVRGGFQLTVNGSPVAKSPVGSGLLRISRTFEVPDADVVLFSGKSGKKGCEAAHMLMAVRQSGEVVGPIEIGNCQPVMNGRIQDRAVVISFPPINVVDWRASESWAYENGQIARVPVEQLPPQ